jgi:hypothetical protein
MSDEPPRPQSIAPRKQWFGLDSPIGVIGAFAALVEVALILATIFVDGNARWALIIFAAGVFIYVSTWFFWILSTKNWVLYPPREYGGETGVATYVEAMKIPIYRRQGVETNGAGAGALVIYNGPRMPNSLGMLLDCSHSMTVQDCLMRIAETMFPEITEEEDPTGMALYYLNYGTSWILRDSNSDQVFDNLGPRWAWKQSGDPYDNRQLVESGLRSGMNIEAHRLLSRPIPSMEIAAVITQTRAGRFEK